MCTHVHSSPTHSSPKLETTQMSVHQVVGWIDCRIVIWWKTTEQEKEMRDWYPQQHGWLSKKFTLSERSQIKKMIPFTENSRKMQTNIVTVVAWGRWEGWEKIRGSNFYKTAGKLFRVMDVFIILIVVMVSRVSYIHIKTYQIVHLNMCN